MTRLKEIDIQDIPNSLPAYDAELHLKTGCTLAQIAGHTIGILEDNLLESMKNKRFGVIPITTGLGRLPGFCEAVVAIIRFMGSQAVVTQQTDVAGISEAINSGIDIIMMADEQQFMALNIGTRKIADNAVATARGFVTALHLMTGSSLWGAPVLVLGCGPVGQNAVKSLLRMKCTVSVYDIDPLKSASVLETYRSVSNGLLERTIDLEYALLKHALIVDATPAGAFIRARHIKADTMISAPGMPLGLDREACEAIGNRLIHDPLQIGVATMLAMAVT